MQRPLLEIITFPIYILLPLSCFTMSRNVWTDFQNEVTHSRKALFAKMTTAINLSIFLLTPEMIKNSCFVIYKSQSIKIPSHIWSPSQINLKLTDKFLSLATGFWISFFWPSNTCVPCQWSLSHSVSRYLRAGPPPLDPQWHWSPSPVTDHRWPVSLRCTLYLMQPFVYTRENWQHSASWIHRCTISRKVQKIKNVRMRLKQKTRVIYHKLDENWREFWDGNQVMLLLSGNDWTPTLIWVSTKALSMSPWECICRITGIGRIYACIYISIYIYSCIGIKDYETRCFFLYIYIFLRLLISSCIPYTRFVIYVCTLFNQPSSYPAQQRWRDIYTEELLFSAIYKSLFRA